MLGCDHWTMMYSFGQLGGVEMVHVTKLTGNSPDVVKISYPMLTRDLFIA